MLPANFVAFLIVSFGAFLPQNDMLLIGIDGEWTRDMTIQFFRFADGIPGLLMAPFEGMGTLFSFNPLLTPSLIPLPLLGDAVGKWLGFSICAALLFLSTYMLGRALGMRRGCSLLASWLLPLLCLPYQSWLNLYLTFNLNPLAGDTISLSMLLLAFLTRAYTSPRALWAALGVLSIVVWLFLANPLWIMILIPTGLLVSIGIMASHRRQVDFVRRTLLLVLPSATFVALGGAPYLLGLFNDTAAAFFSQEMNQNLTHSWRMCTVATAWNDGVDPIGGLWVGLALIGLALVIGRERGVLRAVAISVLAAAAFLAAYITTYWLSSSWALPYPIYFEFALWPFYALFAAYALAEVGEIVISGVRYYYPGVAEPSLCPPIAPWQYVGRWMLVGTVICVLLASNPFTVRPHSLTAAPSETTITQMLQAENGIAPNAGFKGYVVNLTGFNGPGGPPADWFTVLPDSNKAFLAFGNTHRLPYLWRYNVPTLESYAQNTEPAIFSVISRLLDRPSDHQVRNIMLITQTNFPLMESLGVRFLVADYALSEPARLTAKLVTPDMSHFLFELPDPNFGGYSPTEIIAAGDATETLQRMADPDFNFHKTVVLSGSLSLTLQPAKSSSSIVVRGGWRIRAKSLGNSLLLLPLQFSDCLAVTEYQRDGGKVIAVRRANLASTALVFEGTIDVELSEHVSPFWNAYCRLHDAHEMKEFGLAYLPKRIVPGNAISSTTTKD